MKICDKCGTKKVRRLVKVKDVLYGKGYTDYDLCEKCFNETFAEIKKNRGL